MSKNIAFLVLALLSLGLIFIQSTDLGKTKTSVVGDALPQVVKSIDLNKSFNWAGERVPTERQDVRERLDRELTVNAYWHSSTVLNIKKASKFFPLIENILAEEGVPQDFKYLAVAESNLSNVTSKAGAKGFWQFLKGTGKEYGLEINSEVDERYHLEKATRAACKYLKKYHAVFGTWTLAAAAYNRGPNGLEKDKSTQRGNSFYDLNLNLETGRYIFRLVALKEILEQPEQFGFYLEQEHLYPPMNDYYLVDINTSIENWGDIALQYGISYRDLKVYNPWLISHKLTNSSRKSYKIKIPKHQ